MHLAHAVLQHTPSERWQQAGRPLGSVHSVVGGHEAHAVHIRQAYRFDRCIVALCVQNAQLNRLGQAQQHAAQQHHKPLRGAAPERRD